MDYSRIRGIGVSPGIAIGEIHLKERVIFTSRMENILPQQVKSEIERLTEAFGRTRRQLFTLKEEIKDKIGEEHTFVFEAHLMILEDKSLFPSIKRRVDALTNLPTRARWYRKRGMRPQGNQTGTLKPLASALLEQHWRAAHATTKGTLLGR